ncbi:MAG: alpha/beta hydrolase [Rhodospirillales bacterium]|nr:alpha/beta hydrolase [Alphaproteobacteria bacterium]USO02838.1 MAG: alpha/beta hydrolase [Rhodospirillales bacterium]
MNIMKNTPDLAPRFLPPEGWEEDYFNNPKTGHKIRYGYVLPKTPAKAAVVCLGGLSEFAEKYFETARDMLERGFSFWTMDWKYQGLSKRHDVNVHKRHSDGYEQDILDLDHFVTQIVRPETKAPLLLLGHSMGGNIGLRYLSRTPGTFKAAAFSAPMLGIKALDPYGPLANLLLFLLRPFYDSYVPGGKDWHEEMRTSRKTDIFSSDPVRKEVHNAWCLARPDLQVGNPTLGWVRESMKSCRALQQDGALEKIDIPVLLACAGKDTLVSNALIRRAAQHIPQAVLLELPGAYHEILMERDSLRGVFLKGFDKIL